MAKKLDVKESVNLAFSNPVLNYISNAPVDTEQEQSAQIEEKKNLSKLEDVINERAKAKQLKDKRLNILLKESTYKKVKRYAKTHKLSVNELINVLIDSIEE